jgi:hypothetical protein
MKLLWRHKLNPNETIPNVILPNLKIPNWTINRRKYPESNIPNFWGNITKLGEGKAKQGEGERD